MSTGAWAAPMFSAGRASAFAIRSGVGGRFAAVPFQIPPQEAARDRGAVQRRFASHNVGRQMTLQRRQLRGPNLPRQNQFDRTSVPICSSRIRQGGRALRSSPIRTCSRKAILPRRSAVAAREAELKKLNPFAPKRNELPR